MNARRLRIGGLVAVVALVVTSCGLFGDGDQPSPTPTQSSTGSPRATGSDVFNDPAATKLVELGGNWGTAEVTMYVYGIFRSGDYAVLEYGARVTGGSEDSVRLGDFARRGHFLNDPDRLVAQGTTLVDSQAKKAYLPAWDAKTGGQCLCPAFLPANKETTSVGGIAYKAPPAGTSTMDVWLGRGLGYVSGIPVTEGEPPSPPQGFSKWEFDSDKRPGRAEVLDLDTPEANLDLSVTKRKDRLILAADVLFEFDKATLTAKGKARVREAAAILRKEADGRVLVAGFTDSKGSRSYNLRLSERRATTVEKELEPQLTGADVTLVTKGYGEKHPVAKNSRNGKDNPAGRKLNRRVEIVYKR